jgi:hypothetical protein
MSTSPASDPIPLLPVEDVDDDAIPQLVEVVTEDQLPDTSLHWSMFLAASCVLVLAAVLQVRGPETVVIPFVDVPLPGTCTYKKYVGMECPGCGLTRCFISLAHGRPVAAWNFNPAGILFFTIVAGQLPFRGLQIWRIRRGLGEIPAGRLAHYLLGFLIAALISQWLIRAFVE